MRAKGRSWLKEQILEDLEKMTEEQLREAARYVRALIADRETLPPPTSGKSILRLGGIVDDESAREATEVIREDCKQVDVSAPTARMHRGGGPGEVFDTWCEPDS